MKNIKSRPFRSIAMAFIVMILSFALFAGAFTVMSLQRGLTSYQTRLGADIVVVPISATSHGTVDDIFLQGITGNYYISGSDCEKVYGTDGIQAVTRQFYLTSAKASCCSTRVQIIGFDPLTDFTILPWINENYSGTLGDGELVVGSNINVPSDREITFYGQKYYVAAQLAETGTGLDSAVYTNMNTIKQMANDAANLLDTNPFQGVSINTAASAIFIKVADGYSISDVTDDINIHITKVKATAARSMISDIAGGLGGVSRVIGFLVGAIWVLAVIVLAVSFAMLSNERKKEFAVLRVMGASRKMTRMIMGTEAGIVSLTGALAGLIIGIAVVLPLSGAIQNMLGLPFLTPGTGMLAGLFAGVLAVSVVTAALVSLIYARRITNSETGLLLREDA